MEVDYVLLGRHIRAVRKKRGLSQEILAERVAVSTNHIGAIERAETIPSVPVLIALANVLQVTIDELLYDSLSQRRKVYEAQITEILQREPEEFSKHILGYIQFLLGENRTAYDEDSFM